MPVINDYEATAVCDCFGFYNCADRSASYIKLLYGLSFYSLEEAGCENSYVFLGLK